MGHSEMMPDEKLFEMYHVGHIDQGLQIYYKMIQISCACDLFTDKLLSY